LQEETAEPDEPPLTVNKGIKKARPNREVRFTEDQPMRDVQVRYDRMVSDNPNIQVKYAKGLERWNEQEQEKLKEYYGCHPSLLEGLEVFLNSEK
jgi:GrpB-like predicted nucleotidyltransferase (UPF0157 family)